MTIKKEILKIMAGIAMIAIAWFPAISVSAKTVTPEEVIRSYYDDVKDQNVDGILSVLDGEYGEIARDIYTNEETIINHLGLFNISNAEILSVEEIASFDKLGALELCDFDDEMIKVYKVRVNLTTYQEDDGGYCDGINEVYFIFNSSNKIIGCRMIGNLLAKNSSNDNISLLGEADIPVTKPLVNPGIIRVYRTGTKKIEKVEFKVYCKVVAACEAGMPSWDKAALRACAMAIKNIGIVRVYRKKYPDFACDVMDDTSDQVYNPEKGRIKECDDAVNHIWDYYLVDASSRVFPAFYRSSASDENEAKKHAKKHMGVLSQSKAQSLAVNNNYSWKKILKYFYTRESGLSYYNPEVTVGSVSIVQ